MVVWGIIADIDNDFIRVPSALFLPQFYARLGIDPFGLYHQYIRDLMSVKRPIDIHAFTTWICRYSAVSNVRHFRVDYSN